MVKIEIMILILLIISSCNIKSNKKDQNTKDPGIEIMTLKPVIENKYHEMILGDSIVANYINGYNQQSFKFRVDTSRSLLKKIIIYSGNSLIQIINVNKFIEGEQFKLVDWNFDGFKDISVVYNCGTGGCAYWIWNYSDKNKQYYYNAELSEKLGLEIDTKSKFIVFHSRSGWQQENWDSLNYQNSKLVFVKGVFVERSEADKGNTWEKRTFRKIINGNLKSEVVKIKVKNY